MARPRSPRGRPSNSSRGAMTGAFTTLSCDRRALIQRILDGIESRLRTFLVLVGGAAADANPADVDFVRGHDRQAARNRNGSRHLCDARHGAALEILAVGKFLDEAGG